MDGLATLEEVMAYLGPAAAGKDAQVTILLEATAAEIKSYCHKTEGFKLSTKLAHMKWVAKEFMAMTQGANGIAAESIAGASTTFIQGLPEDIRQALDKDRRVIVL